ncbi:MAG: SBBP repeat-containing protein [Promethearchaeota archaeon]
MKNKKRYLIIVIFILCQTLAFQGPSTIFNEIEINNDKNIITYLSTSNSVVIEWYCTWGPNASGTDVAVDSSGNVYVVGGTTNYGLGNANILLVKYDSLGVQQWNRTLGGSEWAGGMAVTVDSFDNVYVVGFIEKFGTGYYDILLAKYDSSGMQQWNRTWGGSEDEIGTAITADSLDNIYVVGETSSFGAGNVDIALLKYDNSGVLLWNRTWGGSYYDSGWGVTEDSSDNVYIVGTGNGYMVLVKYDNSGVQEWNRTWGAGSEIAFAVAVDSSDNAYLVGTTFSFGAGDYDMVLAKYNSSGVLQWNRTWGGVDEDGGEGLAIDSTNDVYVVGLTYSFGAGNGDMFLVKYDSSGIQQWNRTWGGTGFDIGLGISIDLSDNFYVTGHTESLGVGNANMFLVKYGPDIYDPIISINSPSPDDKFGDKAPDYEITIIEPNLESIWYTIDNGITNYSIIQQTGTINQTAWDAASYGNITIEFWAKDLAENIGHSEVVVEKVKKKEEPAIPGYNLFLLIGAIGIITVISLKKKFN